MNKEGPLVSVIVPVYMIDRYLGLCIESILNQIYGNLEIILVDDGSTDRCPEICDLYAEKDSRIKVIHKENGGLVSARKAGLLKATGEYIANVDGDDWIGSGYIGEMVAAAEVTGADAVCAGFSKNLFSRVTRYTNGLSIGLYEGDRLKEFWSSMISYDRFFRTGVYTYLWNKLFRREVITEAQLNADENVSIGEDAAVTYPALLKCRKIAVSDNLAYHYRQREDSMLKSKACYLDEALKIRYLYDYMMAWSEKTPEELGIRKQVIDFVLSVAVIRLGGRIPGADYGSLDWKYAGKRVVLYSAGTFGQQLMTRFKETGQCEVVKWVDDYYWEYRRCCLDVDPVESIPEADYDYILIAKLYEGSEELIIKKLLDLGISRDKILTVIIPEDGKEALLEKLVDIDRIRKTM